MDAVVLRLQGPPLREIQIAEAEVLEDEPTGIDGGQPLHGLAAPHAHSPQIGDQVTDRFATLRPHHLRRLARSFRAGGQRRKLGEIVREHRGRAARLGFLRELGGELARGDLGESEVMHDLAHRPVPSARFPVGLRLREVRHFRQDLRADGFQLAPQSLHGPRQ